MATVQRRYGQDVHEGQDDGEYARKGPEFFPIPFAGESISNADHTAQ